MSNDRFVVARNGAMFAQGPGFVRASGELSANQASLTQEQRNALARGAMTPEERAYFDGIGPGAAQNENADQYLEDHPELGNGAPVSSSEPYIRVAGEIIRGGTSVIVAAMNNANQQELARISAEARERVAQIQHEGSSATTEQQQQLAALTLLVQQIQARQQPTSSSNTPLIIGGAIAAVAIVGAIALSMRARKNPTDRANPVIGSRRRRRFVNAKHLRKMQSSKKRSKRSR